MGCRLCPETRLAKNRVSFPPPETRFLKQYLRHFSLGERSEAKPKRSEPKPKRSEPKPKRREPLPPLSWRLANINERLVPLQYRLANINERLVPITTRSPFITTGSLFLMKNWRRYCTEIPGFLTGSLGQISDRPRKPTRRTNISSLTQTL
jgi:hypothetical protein